MLLVHGRLAMETQQDQFSPKVILLSAVPAWIILARITILLPIPNENMTNYLGRQGRVKVAEKAAEPLWDVTFRGL